MSSEDFYGPYEAWPVLPWSGTWKSLEAQDMGKKHSEELSVKVVDYPNMVYVVRPEKSSKALKALCGGGAGARQRTRIRHGCGREGGGMGALGFFLARPKA